MAMRDRPLADGRPDAPRDGFQADAVLVRGEDLDGFAGMLRRLLGNGIRELFLNAAASSGVADFGFSKSPEETFQKWQGHDVPLADMVRVIRTFRPSS